MHVLVVEDDRETAHFLQKALKESGHAADLAEDGETGQSLAEQGVYDVLIVDRMLPRLDGLSMIRELRNRGVRTPVLILSALGEVDDRVKGLRAGGDDYLTKPYAYSELLARVEALARRAVPEEQETRYVVDGLVLDRLSHRVTRDGEAIQLQPREYRLLEYLMKHAGQVVTRTMLLEHVWDYHFDPQTNVIDVHVSRLRAKIDKNFDKPLAAYRARGRIYDPRWPCLIALPARFRPPPSAWPRPRSAAYLAFAGIARRACCCGRPTACLTNQVLATLHAEAELLKAEAQSGDRGGAGAGRRGAQPAGWAGPLLSRRCTPARSSPAI